MAWIELHQNLPGHPKVKRLARALCLEVPKGIPQVVGHLCMFWLWCLDYAENGSLQTMSAQDIADAAGWYDDPDIFLNAMIKERFIDEVDGALYVHDWNDYAGLLIDRRERERKRNAEKQRRHRERIKQQEKQESSQDTPPVTADKEEQNFAEILGIDQDWADVVKCYEKNIGVLPYGVSCDILQSYFDDLGGAVLCKAIEVTNKAQPNNPWKYLNSVLKKWLKNKIDTPEKADAYTKDLERRLAEAKSSITAEKVGADQPPAIIGDFY